MNENTNILKRALEGFSELVSIFSPGSTQVQILANKCDFVSVTQFFP